MKRFVSRTSPVPIYAGVALVMIGFGLIAYAWGRVAGLESVALQLPYVASAAIPGLGLVVIGVTVVAVQAKRQDAAARLRQLAELSVLIADRGDR